MRKKLIFVIIAFSFSYGCNTSKNVTDLRQIYTDKDTPYEVALNNAYKLGFQNGEKVGYDKGKELGNLSGFEKGKRKGIKEGYNAGLKDGEKKGLQKKIVKRFEKNMNIDTREKWKDYYLKEGFEEGKRIGIQQTKDYVNQKEQDYGFNLGYTAGLHENIRNITFKKEINFNEIDSEYIPKYDYESIINLVDELADKNDKAVFDKILKIIHTDMLQFVIDELGLTEKEKEAALNEYNINHEGLTNDYFEAFNKSFSETNINQTQEFNYYTTYYSTDILIDIISTGASMVLSGVLAAATLNPGVAIAASMASSVLLKPLISNILYAFEDDLKKYALFKTFNKLQVELQNITRDFIGELIVLKETYDEIIKKEEITKVFFGILSAQADVTLRVQTAVFYGFNINKIHCDLNHAEQEFVVYFPDIEINGEPYQNYEFLEVDDSNWTDKIDENFLNDLFSKAKQLAYDKADYLIKNEYSSVKKMAKKQAILSLQKLFYPIISFPKPYYKIYIDINGEKYNIYEMVDF